MKHEHFRQRVFPSFASHSLKLSLSLACCMEMKCGKIRKWIIVGKNWFVDWFAALNDMSLETCTTTINSQCLRWCCYCLFYHAYKCARVTKSFCNNLKLFTYIKLCTVHTEVSWERLHIANIGVEPLKWKTRANKRTKISGIQSHTKLIHSHPTSMRKCICSLSKWKLWANNKDPTKQCQRMI